MPGENARLNDRELLDVEPDLQQVYNRDPAFRYRWTHKNGVNVARKKLLGYEVCTGQSGEHLGAVGPLANGQGTALELADMVLMRIPVELYERRERMRAERAHKRERAVDTLLAKEIADAGKKGIHVIGEQQAARELGYKGDE